MKLFYYVLVGAAFGPVIVLTAYLVSKGIFLAINALGPIGGLLVIFSLLGAMSGLIHYFTK